jgi:hypothetical protein
MFLLVQLKSADDNKLGKGAGCFLLNDAKELLVHAKATSISSSRCIRLFDELLEPCTAARRLKSCASPTGRRCRASVVLARERLN